MPESGVIERLERFAADGGGVVFFVGNQVDVNGHTGPEPVANPAFPSNWELSLAQAMAVADELRAGGYVDNIHAFGLGASRFGDLSLSASVEERHRLARRVDIVVRRSRPAQGAP